MQSEPGTGGVKTGGPTTSGRMCSSQHLRDERDAWGRNPREMQGRFSRILLTAMDKCMPVEIYQRPGGKIPEGLKGTASGVLGQENHARPQQARNKHKSEWY